MSNVSSRKYPICLCMIVKNEARLLAQVLKSAEPIVSQIVVVDTGSTDQSVEIARQMGAEVYQHPWENSFAKARNQSLSYARQPWIFILDGDELLDQESLDVFATLDLSPSAKENAYALQVVNYTTDQKLASESHLFWQVRLFKNIPAHGYDRHVHNQILDLPSQTNLSGPQVHIRILHDGYTPSVWAKQKKDDRLQMLIAAVQADEADLFAHFNLANHLKILKRYDSALSHYQIVVDACLQHGFLSTDFDLDDRRNWFENAFYSAAFCANQCQRFDLGIQLCDQLLSFEPHLADPWQRKIEALFALKRFDLVMSLYEKFMQDEHRKAMKQKAFYDLSYRYAIACYQQKAYQKGFDALHAYFETQVDITVFNYLALFAVELGDEIGFWICLLRAHLIDPLDADLLVIYRHYLERSQIGKALAKMGYDLTSLQKDRLLDPFWDTFWDTFWEKIKGWGIDSMKQKKQTLIQSHQEHLSIFQMLDQEIPRGFSVTVMGGEGFLNWECISQVLGDLPFERRWWHRLNQGDWLGHEEAFQTKGFRAKQGLCFLICMHPDSQFFGGIALVESAHVECIAQRVMEGNDLSDREIHWRYFREVEWQTLAQEDRLRVNPSVRSRLKLSWRGFWTDEHQVALEDRYDQIVLEKGLALGQMLQDEIALDQIKFEVYLTMMGLIET
jgi:glycosyltransferase involved in cell wall biosynthesis